MQFLKTLDLKETKTKKSINNQVVITESLAFSKNLEDNESSNKTFPEIKELIKIHSNLDKYLTESVLPSWAKNLVKLFSPGPNLFHFNVDSNLGWMHFPKSIFSSDDNNFEEVDDYYLIHKNSFPVTRINDLEFTETSNLSIYQSHEGLLRTGWPLEIYITKDEVKVYSLKSKNPDLKILESLLPKNISFTVLDYSSLIGPIISAYKYLNINNPTQFIVKEDYPKLNLEQTAMNRLCLGSLATPETICRNFISNLSKIQANIPASINKIVRV